MVATVLYYAVPAVIVLYGIRKYRESKWGKCKNAVRMDGKIVLITGANSGVGYETAKELAHRGAHVVFACRNETLALKAIKQIRSELRNNAKLDFVRLDLANLQSIKTFAGIVRSNYAKIDVLINNAGVSYPSDKKHLTDDGFEMHFGVNYLGHFLLTHLLLDFLKKADRCRIINVSSLLHQKGSLHLDDLNYERTSYARAYSDSKLMNVYFTRELARRTKDTGIKVYALCPGWVYTNLFRHSMRNVFKVILALPIALLFMRSAKQGAQTSVFCATDESIEEESGKMYRECREYESTHKFDDEDGKRLWELSEALLNLKD